VRRHLFATAAVTATAAALLAPLAHGDSSPVGTIPTSYNAYVGSLHEHSGYSDGWVGSTPATYYASGKHFGLDFMGGSDHSDFLGVPLSTSEYCTDPATTPSCVQTEPNKWGATLDQAKAATDATFTGFRGFEWTSDPYGHIGVYFSKNMANAKVDGYPTQQTLYDWLARRPELGGGSDGLAVFNHPGAKDQLKPVREQLGLQDQFSKNWKDFAYDPRVDDQFVGMEVYNDVDEYGMTRDYPEGYLSHVLDKGWHVAPVGAEDLGHRRTDDWGGPGWAKTVILATDRSPAALKAAMRARRMYAVREQSTRIGFHVDGAEMGSRLSRPTGSALALEASVNKPGLTLQVVTSKGAVVATGTDSLTVSRAASAGEKYYFLRVLDGTRPVAFSAPVWIQSGAAVRSGEWLAGDLHVHTCYSHDAYCPGGASSPDDDYLPRPVSDALDTLGLGDDNTSYSEVYTAGGTVDERFAEASLKGLDYLAITDHQRVESVTDPGFGSHQVVGVPGYENSIGGHAQMLGATRVYPSGDHGTADTAAMAAMLRADGGVFQANHPADGIGHPMRSCADTADLMWRYSYDIQVDTVEVWNTNHALQEPLPAAAANDDAITYWECMLSRGWHVAATGGGDSHWVSVAAAQGVGNPTTWVFAPERSARGVLTALREGRTSISIQTPLAGATQLLLEADADRDGVYESMMGDTVPAGTPVRLRALGTPGAGLVTVRANGHDLLSNVLLKPGKSVDLVAPAGGWLWASLSAPDALKQRQKYCDPKVGSRTTLCRYEVGMLAMTSALYVG
jgi:predicted metal-dependent phosphoesterase TrpH